MERKISLLVLAVLLLGASSVWGLSAQGPDDGLSEYRYGRPQDWWTRYLAADVQVAVAQPLDAPLDFAHYPTYAEVIQFCTQLQSEHADLVSFSLLGSSSQGRQLPLLTLGNRTNGDPNARPALYLDGQHHAREAISQLATLYFAWWLAENYTTDSVVNYLLNTRTVYIVPMVNPDGNELWLTSDASQRRTANPTTSDDDYDGILDEDGYEGVGYGSHDRYLVQFDAAWVAAHADDILASGWEAHVQSELLLGLRDAQGQPLPQTDNDGDGRKSEDPPGGVDANRNYDAHWSLGSSSVSSEVYRGPTPFSEPETQAVRDLVWAHENIATGVTLHSGTDMILYPWGWTKKASSVRTWLDNVARKGSQLTACNGYDGSRYGQISTALYSVSGATVDWLHQEGIYSWTPEIYGGDTWILAERIGDSDEYYLGESIAGMFDPASDEILSLVDRWRRFLLYVLAATPNIEVNSLGASADHLALQIANDGYLPVDVELEASSAAGLVVTRTLTLQAGQQWVEVPYDSASASGTLTVTLDARVTIDDNSRLIEQQELLVHAQTVGGAPVMLWVEGQVQPWVDLGAAFGDGGWQADESVWGNARYYITPESVVSLPLIVARPNP